jgi:anti-sigma factor RsiW
MARGALSRFRFARDHRWVPPRASDYLDGDLTPPEVARVQRHVGECPECRELLQELEEIVVALRTLRDDQGELVAGTVLASVRVRLGETPPAGG